MRPGDTIRISDDKTGLIMEVKPEALIVMIGNGKEIQWLQIRRRTLADSDSA
ncbi:hypothetical protein C8P63_14710 [Melghirimyces profundicolus]|uniref:Uncharacterized protein n=1 Tax=Melghirimyces profundicolus TaxID=1242148 RepID=A0A2T6AWE2_9BACL|nr:hypothetical protein [Melghirimyces profundicolus]PTX48138.1 hypothetical protein C8P63_14710 [Melghirimyces profundicolus]